MKSRTIYMREYHIKRCTTTPEFLAKKLTYAKKYREEKIQEDPEWRERDNRKKRNRYYENKTEAPWLLTYYRAKNRCNNPENDSYQYYGGKGVRMLLTKVEIEK